MPAEPDARLLVASVAKAMQVLSAFDATHRAMTIAEVAARTGMGRSAAQRFVYTLHHLGYLQRDEGSRQYAPSTRVLSLVKGMLDGNPMLERGQPVLAELARATGETVSWVELDGDEIVIVANLPSVHAIQVRLPVGSRFAALPSSSGQALLWDEPRERLAQRMRRLEPAQRARLASTDVDGLLALLHKARRAGYALTERHLDPHGVSLSAPVLGVDGRAVAAINVSTLKGRFDAGTARRELAPRLVAAARSLSV